MGGATDDVTTLLHELRNRLMPMQLRVDAGRHLAAGTALEPLMVSLQASMQDLAQWVDAKQRVDPVGEGAEQRTGMQKGHILMPVTPLHVLLVDDNDMLASALCDFASGDPRFASMRQVRCAADAWEYLSSYAPDVVVLDVHLPDADGIALCVALRERYPTVPVAILSGTFDAILVDESRVAGAAGFIAKGSDPHATLEAFVSVSRGGWTTLLP